MNVADEPGSCVVEKRPCPRVEECGSSDACALYDDGHSHCFSCGHHFPAGDDAAPREPRTPCNPDLIRGLQYVDLPKRGLRADTCKRYGYGVGEAGGRAAQVAPYHNAAGEVVAQKLRFADKSFSVRGELKQAGLFGQQLFRTGGKMVVVTEGEIDALSVAQAMGNKWPAVSVPSGAQGAVKAIKANLEWLASNEAIILWFDSDEPGREALEKVLPLLPPGKAKVITGPADCKDANDVLLKHGAQAIVSLVWDAPTWRPGGIVSGKDITLASLMAPEKRGWQTPYPKLNEITRGIRAGEVVLLTAGSGIGKSTDAREMLYKAVCDGLTVGAVFLEESKDTTAKAMIALDNNVLLADLREDASVITDAQWAASHRKLIDNGRYFAYDHFGSVDSENLMSKLEYLAVSCGCELIVLDHISIAVSGLEIDADERRVIDVLMTKLKSLAQRTGTRFIVISHLRKVGGGAKSFEQGGQISLDDLRGSGSLKQLSDTVVARERDQQAEDEADRDLALIRVLKCRYTGRTGPADTVRYDTRTGRVKPLAPDEFGDETGVDDDIPF